MSDFPDFSHPAVPMVDGQVSKIVSDLRDLQASEAAIRAQAALWFEQKTTLQAQVAILSSQLQDQTLARVTADVRAQVLDESLQRALVQLNALTLRASACDDKLLALSCDAHDARSSRTVAQRELVDAQTGALHCYDGIFVYASSLVLLVLMYASRCGA
jgi:hypothetical protein